MLRGTDFNDLHQAEGLEVVRQYIDEARPVIEDAPKDVEAQPKPQLNIITIHGLLSLDIPERESLLHPVILAQSLEYGSCMAWDRQNPCRARNGLCCSKRGNLFKMACP